VTVTIFTVLVEPTNYFSGTPAKVSNAHRVRLCCATSSGTHGQRLWAGLSRASGLSLWTELTSTQLIGHDRHMKKTNVTSPLVMTEAK
jgi:hypothetical protein